MSLTSLVLAGLAVGFCGPAQGQSAGGGEPILFSSPEGETATNRTLPLLEWPGPQELPKLPVEAPTVLVNPPIEFEQPLPEAPPVIGQTGAQKRTDDGQKPLRLLTPEEVMGIPTPEEIFGLPEPATNGEPASMSPEEHFTDGQDQAQGEETNEFSIKEMHWQEILSGGGQEEKGGAKEKGNGWGAAEAWSGLWGRIFNGPPRNDVFGDLNGTGSGPGAGPPPAEPGLDSGGPLFGPAATAWPTPGPRTAAKTPLPDVGMGFSPNTSPFAAPGGSFSEMAPQLPVLPGITSQNQSSTQPVAPAWAPTPAPWLAPVPALGTVPQRKF